MVLRWVNAINVPLCAKRPAEGRLYQEDEVAGLPKEAGFEHAQNKTVVFDRGTWIFPDLRMDTPDSSNM